MNQIFTCVIVVFLYVNSVAQITIQQSDMMKVGDSLITIIDSTNLSGLSPGPSGANQLWNFSSLNNDSQDTIFVVDPSTTPNGALFPNSNICFRFMEDSLEAFLYLNSSSTSLEIDGLFSEDYGIPADFNPNTTILDFPANYMSTLYDMSGFDVKMFVGDTIDPGPPVTILDSLRLKQDIIRIDTVDGWGTVQTPLGSYECLRQKSMEISIDTIFAHSTFGGFPIGWLAIITESDTLHSYNWLAKQLGYYIVEMYVDENGDVTSANYLLKQSADGIEELERAANYSLYPNPASDLLFVQSREHTTGSISLYDIHGRVVITETIENGINELNINRLVNGMYFYHIFDGESNPISSGKLNLSN